MKVSKSSESGATEIQIQNAIVAYNSRQYRSIGKIARAFKVPYSTMKDCLSGASSRAQARETQQNLSNAEEKILVRWITRLTATGFPASLKLVLEMAEEIRRERVFLAPQASSGSLGLRPVGHNWLTRFKQCNLEISGIWTR